MKRVRQRKNVGPTRVEFWIGPMEVRKLRAVSVRLGVEVDVVAKSLFQAGLAVMGVDLGGEQVIVEKEEKKTKGVSAVGSLLGNVVKSMPGQGGKGGQNGRNRRSD